MIRVVLPAHLRTIAKVSGEVALDVPGVASMGSVLDALEARYPTLQGTIRDHVTKQRRPFVRFFACENDRPHDIRKLRHFGTTPAAIELAVADAIAFHERIGGANKEARLRWLKDYWTSRVRELPRVRLMTPGGERSCAIAAFRIEGMASADVAKRLLQEHRIFTVALEVAGVDVVRVTPHLYTTTEHLDCLVTAITTLSR